MLRRKDRTDLREGVRGEGANVKRQRSAPQRRTDTTTDGGGDPGTPGKCIGVSVART